MNEEFKNAIAKKIEKPKQLKRILDALESMGIDTMEKLYVNWLNPRYIEKNWVYGRYRLYFDDYYNAGMTCKDYDILKEIAEEEDLKRNPFGYTALRNELRKQVLEHAKGKKIDNSRHVHEVLESYDIYTFQDLIEKTPNASYRGFEYVGPKTSEIISAAKFAGMSRYGLI